MKFSFNDDRPSTGAQPPESSANNDDLSEINPEFAAPAPPRSGQETNNDLSGLPLLPVLGTIAAVLAVLLLSVLWLLTRSITPENSAHIFQIHVRAHTTPITAPVDGRISSVYVSPQQQVTFGAPLLVIQQGESTSAAHLQQEQQRLQEDLAGLEGLLAETNAQLRASQNSISQQQQERQAIHAAAVSAAKADLDATQQRLTLAAATQNDLAAARARLQQAEAAAADASGPDVAQQTLQAELMRQRADILVRREQTRAALIAADNPQTRRANQPEIITVQAAEAGVITSNTIPTPQQRVRRGETLLTLGSNNRRWLEIITTDSSQTRLHAGDLWLLQHPQFSTALQVRISRPSPIAKNGQVTWQAIASDSATRDALQNLAIDQHLQVTALPFTAADTEK